MKPQTPERSATQTGLQDYGAGAIIAGKYRLLHPLGEGGMGSVWAAHSQALDINVALKLIRLDIANEEAPQRMIQEARATARLADPGIVRMFDVGCTERGDPFIAMELLTGTTLLRALEAGPLQPIRAVRLLLPIVRALETAHRAGVVHRDVKPENILFAVGARGDLQPKLVDFGVAKLLTNQDQLTDAGAVVGSPQYMSPEQARGEPVDHRTDLWSLCVVLHEATVGVPPFTAENTHALLHAICTQEFRWSAQRGNLDPALAEIIGRGLAKDRAQRWQHARELTLALAQWLRSQNVTEDITGVALRGRGLGDPSSLPGPPLEPGSPSGRRPAGTVVNLAALALPASSSAAADSNSDAAALRVRESSPDQLQGLERRVGRAAALALLALGLLAVASLSHAWFRGNPAAAPAAPERAAEAPKAPAAILALPSNPAKPAAASKPASVPKPAGVPEPAVNAPLTASASERPPRRARERAAPRKAVARSKPRPTAPRPPAAPVPFKNPFE